MLFQSFTSATLLALMSLSDAAALKFRRASESDVTLFCYGSYANGASLFYADGLAYFGGGNSTSLNATVQTEISFTVDDSDTTVAWTIQPNSSTVSFNSTLSMYILPTTGSFSQVGFSTTADLPSGAVDTGFAFMGTNVAYAASESNYEMMFWGTNTTSTGIFALNWNAAAAVADIPEGAFPVTVKTTHPVSFNKQ